MSIKTQLWITLAMSTFAMAGAAQADTRVRVLTQLLPTAK